MSSRAVLAQIREAEQHRNAGPLSEDLSSSREESVRIATARARSRIAEPSARDALLASLADESPAVVRWAAFGLGQACSGREQEFAAALALRAASFLSSSEATAAEVLPPIADALARCASPEAERTLRAWLLLEPATESAAIALGKLGARRGRLEEASLVQLLDAASRSENPVSAALYAFTRLAPPEGGLAERLLDVGTRVLQTSARDGSLAIRALGRLGQDAVRPLSLALAEDERSAIERVEAARELGKLGNSGKGALAQALAARVQEGATFDLTQSPGESDVLLAMLEGLETRSNTSRAALERLARWSVPTTPREARRAIELRCSAARLLAGSASANDDLRACDPNPEGHAGKLALLFVLDRGALSGARGRRFRELLVDDDARVRQAALRLLPAHREFTDSPELLTRALLDASPGVVATAAELLSKHPERASTAPPSVQPFGAARPARSPDPELVSALSQALRKAAKSPNIEVHGALLDATAALAVLSLNQELEEACASDNPTLRERADRARKLLSHTASACERKSQAALPAELSRLIDRPVRLVFETDAGELSLELLPEEAPVSATRLRDLAKSGFYEGVRAHRVVPGFVVQLGDPGGDGYGGAPLPPLRSELSPTPFEPGAVGIALSGRDTGNSQFFVTLGRFPHLDGEYTRVGRAGPGWERLRSGDRVHRVRLE